MDRIDTVNSYIAIDVETTGLSPKHDRIIEIGALKVINGAIEGKFHSLINPNMLLPQKAKEITGISDEDLLDKPLITDIIFDLRDFIGELPLLGHMIIADFSFIKKAMVNSEILWEASGIDTLKICRRLMPEDKKKNLSFACEYYGIKNTSFHRALDDATATHLLYKELLKYLTLDNKEVFEKSALVYNVKKEQLAGKRQKEHLHKLLNYHKIVATVDIEALSKNDISRMIDKIISKHGRIDI